MTDVQIRAGASYDLPSSGEIREHFTRLEARFAEQTREELRGLKLMRFPSLSATAVGASLVLPATSSGYGLVGPESGFLWKINRLTVATNGTDGAGAVRGPTGGASITLTPIVVTSPTAGQVLATATVPIAGTYTVNWNIILGGTLGTPERNNVALEVNGVTVGTSNNGINSGTVYTQNPQQIVIPAGATVTLNAIALGTAASVYSAGGTITPDPQSGPATGAAVALYTTSDESQQQRNLIDSSLQVGVAFRPGTQGMYLMPGEGVSVVIASTPGNTYTLTGQVWSVPAEMMGKLA
jgi:hypothetical protein